MTSYNSTCYTQHYSDNSEVVERFLNTFQILSAKQKKIWQVLQWFATHHRQVFPSQSTIAKKAGCCRDTVIQTLKKFAEWGWVFVKKRCFRSCVYFIQDCLKKFDTKNDDTFRVNPTETPTVNPTLYNTYSSLSNERYEKPQKTEAVQSSKDEKERFLIEMGINDPKDIWCLKRYPMHILIKAREDAQTRVAKEPIYKLPAWITNRCKQYFK